MVSFDLHLEFNAYDMFKKNMKEELDWEIKNRLEDYINSDKFKTILNYDDISDNIRQSFFNEDYDVLMKYIKPDMESLNFIGLEDSEDTLYFEIDIDVDIDRYIKNKGL